MFSDVKAGDKIAIIRKVGITSGFEFIPARSFVIHESIVRVTSTMIVTDSDRFSKRGGYNLSNKRDLMRAFKTSDLNDDFNLSQDQSLECDVYLRMISNAMKHIEDTFSSVQTSLRDQPTLYVGFFLL